MRLSDFPIPLLLGFATTLGLLFGSFLNVVIYRLPRDENLAFPASHCTSCGSNIAPYDNIPVLSWLLLNGKARCCGASISPRYPVVEALGGLLAFAIMHRVVLPIAAETSWYGGLGLFAIYLALGLALVAMVFIDLEHLILPDELTLGGTALGLLTLPFRPVPWDEALLGGGLGFLLVWGVFHHGYRLLRGQVGMGLGDAKLLLLAGVWFGWQGALFTLVAASVQGTVVALAVFLTRGKIDEPEAIQRERQEYDRQLQELPPEEREALQAEYEGDIIAEAAPQGLSNARIAFGPFLALSIMELLLAGDWIMHSLWSYFMGL